ncbi:4-alpha-glucanotransferase [Rouxiella sp. Mn2063]|uniref:4-alpha-glucanotransferase n=1 Tax=Rouxiella sp. Mn2063 TaxID=3395262 RepID=UPI003BCE1E65
MSGDNRRDTSLAQAAEQAGIIDNFINMQQQVQSISDDTKRTLLAIMKGEHHAVPAASPLPPVVVFIQGEDIQLTAQGGGAFDWQLTQENGELSQGKIDGGRPLVWNQPLPLGYHQLTLLQNQQRWQSRIIIAPARCYEPPALVAGEKLWGATVQLYTLRSENNWGIGDFGDLKLLVEHIARRGGAFVGLNPIHALYPANPFSASPYSPSSRRWLNIIYIDVNAVAEFAQSTAAQAWWQEAVTRDALLQARGVDNVDYSQVMGLKLQALKLAWPTFSALPADSSRKQAFQRFVLQGGESLRQLAVFDALHMHLRELDLGLWGWPVWPEVYRQADSPDVAEFIEYHQDDIAFYQWLQWLAASQLAQCYQASQRHNMPIGLYRDLAVGVAEGGAETWSDPDLYCLAATIGAPPDLLGPQGQNWGLPPIDPHIMQQRAYQPFIDLLRANMAQCGALRIDHVMGLLRLWWIPANGQASEGAYVRYPLHDLLGILALESHRHQCMVIGEDLGIVPDEIVTSLHDSGVYSYKVLYFEHDSDWVYHSPQDYLTQAMATLNTHDLPTLRGYWQAEDLTLGKTLGIYPDADVLENLYQERERSKQGLLEALHHADCLPEKVAHDAKNVAMNPLLNRGLHRYLAASNSAMLGLQPEDWLDMSTPVNVPGTNTEYPNWRRKLACGLDEIFSNPEVNRLLKDVDQRRKNTDG